MTSQRLVADYARYLWVRDYGAQAAADYIPDSYMNEAAVFLAGGLGQRLQRGAAERIAAQLREFASEQPEPSGFAVAGLAVSLVGGLRPLSDADIAAGQRVERELGAS